MEKIANLDLPSFSDRMQAEVVAAIQAELTATIDDLANSVRHLALRAKLTESIVDAREAERSAEALRIAGTMPLTRRRSAKRSPGPTCGSPVIWPPMIVPVRPTYILGNMRGDR